MTRPELVLLHAPSNYDFRERSVVYGPISDVIPSSPIFEMYPIGFISIAGYLEKHRVPTRIVNIANRMLGERDFDVERFVSKLRPLAFGIDLHWLPHAQGSLELARVVKTHHPSTPIIFGGLSATYFYEELIRYPQVDYVVRGDSAEEPMLRLMRAIKGGEDVGNVPNLSWKDENGAAHHNDLSWVPSNLDDIPLDYNYPVKSVIKYRSLRGVVPFSNWLDYPITAVFTCRGCTLNCRSCGGSKFFFKQSCNRNEVAYRSPALLAEDIHSIQRYLNGPVFIIGDIRQPGEDYADELLSAMKRKRTKGPVVLELLAPAGQDFFRRVSQALPNYNIQMSPESHDEEVRRAFGKGWRNADVEGTMQAALENNCQRFDLFYMIGLPKQDHASVMGTVGELGRLLKEFGARNMLHPHISPLSPFVDPGSQIFERPEEYGYTLLCRTLEEHRQALLAPAWSYMLNYETQWLSRSGVADATYEAALGFNRVKKDYGLIDSGAAEEVESRIKRDRLLIEQLDRWVAEHGEASFKHDEAELCLAATCSKRELEWPSRSFLRSMPKILWNICQVGRFSGA